MAKYAIDKEFRILKSMRLPADTRLLPVANTFLEVMRGRTDGKVKVQKVKIPGCHEDLIPVYVIEPKGLEGVRSCLMDFHGGGFMMKGSPAHFARAKEYAYQLKCTVIFPDYRLIPKHPYPVPTEDCFQAYRWMVDHAKELEIDVSKIAVLGDSAGGNLAAAVTLMARDRGLPMPCYQMLLYPVLDGRMETESMRCYTDTPVWDARLSKLMWELYLKQLKAPEIETQAKKQIEVQIETKVQAQTETQVQIVYASPAEIEDISGMPDTYIEVAEFDCLRDEGIAFAKKLKAAGVSVELHKVPGSVHGYDVLMKSKTVKKLMQRRVSLLKEKLRQP